MHVLVTGATGYIGGRLVPSLLDAGHDVRCLARTPSKLDGRPWREDAEVVEGDVSDHDSVVSALDGVDVAYYLIHSMDGEGDFRERDRRFAATFRDAAATAGVGRIVYLGGLGTGEELSEHLESRHEVGRVLADGPVPVTELRAAVIIGSGSASFEMLRNLVDVLPAMVTPRWVDTRCQPIGVGDMLDVLVGVLEEDASVGRILQVGGPDVLPYRRMMTVYAEEAGIRPPLVVPVPVLTPKLSSLWIGLVTPMPSGLARPLVESLRTEVVVEGDAAVELLDLDPVPYREAVRLALRPPGEGPAAPWPEDPDWAGGGARFSRGGAARRRS